jgi:two-component system KDP operon response regulator KdpE
VSLSVLLVEDDRELRRTLRQALTVEGHRVLGAASLVEAQALLRESARNGGIDLVLLDLTLPDGDGETLLGALRRQGDVPVIVISARQNDAPKIRLLDAGADDYLVKPFSLGELLARMRVALRHRGTYTKAAITRYEHEDLMVDLEAHRVRLGNAEVHLTPTEFKLLARLVRSAGKVVTHRQLLVDVWGPEYVGHTHYLRLYMGQLRGKLENDSADPRRLLTEPGVGYRLVEPSQPIDPDEPTEPTERPPGA